MSDVVVLSLLCALIVVVSFDDDLADVRRDPDIDH